MIKIVYHKKAHNVRAWIDLPEGAGTQPQDCHSVYGAIGRLVMKNPKLFNIQEIKAYDKQGGKG